MNVWEKITGSDISKQMKTYEVRIKTLPTTYQKAWQSIKETIYPYSDLTGRNLLPIFEGIVFMLEEANSNQQSIEELFGDDLHGFCLALVTAEGATSYREKWREQLNHNVHKKLAKREEQ